MNGIEFILAPEAKLRGGKDFIGVKCDRWDSWLTYFIVSYLLVKTKMDEIISQGIKKPWCSDLLADANNSMVELEKPSTLFKQGHPTAIFGKYLFERRFKI